MRKLEADKSLVRKIQLFLHGILDSIFLGKKCIISAFYNPDLATFGDAPAPASAGRFEANRPTIAGEFASKM